ncbi:TIGR01906 family membrane protein [Garciella nitratireducens]|uniref:Integral membrane protein TIGR01906 n=1 Tax=Garciella nitratireducens DSM 15102 TaxID=1121911 RepID=A0A1T4LZ03_9FIRM|nr:TIGR01906 family membrane protein [Garciella nitratireducens]SJZ59969.1 integral membrane protein TIGR01906 [Garciella nitratireducens DSM 15102]
MEKAFKTISCWIIFITLPLIFLLNSIEITAFDLDFYGVQYDKNQVVENTGIKKPELMNVTKEMLQYLKGDRQDLKVYGEVNGQKQLIFNEKERTHMEDVKELFSKGFIFRNFSLVFFVISFIYLVFIKKEKRKVAKAIFLSATITILIFIVLGMIISTDFSKYFDIFHYIFFDNDLWQLDPKESILINLVPLGFFQSIVIRIALYFFGSLLFCILLSGWYLKKFKKTNYIFIK